MNLGLGLSLGARGAGFSPAALFSAGEQGAWYDPSDFSTMFQDIKGTIPVTAVGQPVGLWLDKSRGLARGAELVTNGDFSAGSSGWSEVNPGWTLSGGVASCNLASGFNHIVQLLPSLVEGRTYEVRIDVVTRTSGGVALYLGNSGTAGGQVHIVEPTSVGSYVFRSTVPVGEAKQILIRAQNGFIGSIDNISVRELPGNHGTQPTAASRPVLGRVPVGGRRNLLTFTEQFDDAAWTKNNATVTANAAAAPDGTMTADAIIEDTAASSTHFVRQNLTLSAGQATFSVDVKATGRTAVRLANASYGNAVYFGLTGAGVVGAADAATGAITNVGDGWYRCSITWAATAGANAMDVRLAVGTTAGSDSYTGNGTSGVFARGAQLETGSTATNYQRVVTALDVTQAGVPDCYYLSFDGTDDFMLTPTITPGTDKAQVFAGVRKLGTAAAILAELSVNAGTNLGSFYVVAPDSTAEYSAASHGSAGIAVDQISSVTGVGQSPDTAVISTLADIAADSTIIRRNGLAFPAGTGDQGTGNYLAYPLYIGRRGGTSLPFNGQIFSLIVRFGANLPAATITQAEAFVNSKTGAY